MSVLTRRLLIVLFVVVGAALLGVVSAPSTVAGYSYDDTSNPVRGGYDQVTNLAPDAVAETARLAWGLRPHDDAAGASLGDSGELSAPKGMPQPTHPTLRPGPYAAESIPARGPQQTFTAAERAQIDELGLRYGCHTCGTTSAGTKSGHFVPDHQPVSGLNFVNAPQRLFPQCLACSRVQGGATGQYLEHLRQLGLLE